MKKRISLDVEDIVIRAAYKALSQRYHPDKFKGSAVEADAKMKEINIAYGILSDKDKRKAYDEELKASGKDKEFSEEQSQPDFEEHYSGEIDDWKYVLEYHPEIEKYFNDLKKINEGIAFAFRETLLESKNFKNSEQVFSAIREKFIARYFGDNVIVRHIVDYCLENERRDILKEVNKAVRIFGSDVDVVKLKKKIKEEYNCTLWEESDVPYEKGFLEGWYVNFKKYMELFLYAGLLSIILFLLATVFGSLT